MHGSGQVVASADALDVIGRMSDQRPTLPEYACAIITRPDGWYLLQVRPHSARHAPGQLTCFGGAREGDESDQACIVRELLEELNWSPATLEVACDLRRGARYIARFFRCVMPHGVALRTEPNQVALWAPPTALPGLPLSPWHQAVLAAVARGETVVELPA
jgi:8-oxo-dGTP pyrophosphatase MutT (NUDIX family)